VTSRGQSDRRRGVTPAERFWTKVDRSGGPDACWPWTCPVQKNGYAVFHPTRTRPTGAHRYAWEQANGPIPEGASIDHTCHNGTGCPGGPTCPHRRCCNVRHLDATTLEDNTDRSHNANQHKTRCKRDHPFTPDNTKWQRPKRPGHRPSRACRECIRLRERRHPITEGPTP
jgi:hypothetical protein